MVLELSHYLEEPTGSTFSADFTWVFRGHNSNCFNKLLGWAEQIIRSRHQVTHWTRLILSWHYFVVSSDDNQHWVRVWHEVSLQPWQCNLPWYPSLSFNRQSIYSGSAAKFLRFCVKGPNCELFSITKHRTEVSVLRKLQWWINQPTTGSCREISSETDSKTLTIPCPSESVHLHLIIYRWTVS